MLALALSLLATGAPFVPQHAEGDVTLLSSGSGKNSAGEDLPYKGQFPQTPGADVPAGNQPPYKCPGNFSILRITFATDVQLAGEDFIAVDNAAGFVMKGSVTVNPYKANEETRQVKSWETTTTPNRLKFSAPLDFMHHQNEVVVMCGKCPDSGCPSPKLPMPSNARGGPPTFEDCNKLSPEEQEALLARLKSQIKKEPPPPKPACFDCHGDPAECPKVDKKKDKKEEQKGSACERYKQALAKKKEQDEAVKVQEFEAQTYNPQVGYLTTNKKVKP